jgi:hypothetical protein
LFDFICAAESKKAKGLLSYFLFYIASFRHFSSPILFKNSAPLYRMTTAGLLIMDSSGIGGHLAWLRLLFKN